MNNLLFSPPLAFLIYLGLAGILSLIGRKLAGQQAQSSLKSSLYSSGEESPADSAAPGYRQFFTIALFFAILHLGVLMLGSFVPGTGIELNWMAGAYLTGLILALVALVLG